MKPWLGLVLLVVACRFDQSVGDSVAIRCADNSECPSTRICSPVLHLCIKEVGDKDAPSLVSLALSPSVASRSTVVKLELSTNEPLLGSPAFSIDGFTQTARAPFEGGEHLSFTYAVPTGATEGTLDPKVHLIDLSGNESEVPVGSLTLDFTPPSVVTGSVTVRPELARPGEAVLVQVAFSEPLGAAPMLEVGNASPLAPISSAGAYASFQVLVDAATADGELTLSLPSIVDLAGNSNTPGKIGSIRVDTNQPRITTLEIVGGATVFSANPGFNTFTVIAEGDVGTGDSLRSLDVSLLGVPVTCASPTPTRRECVVSIVGSMAEGDATVQAVATDAAGNSAAKSVIIRLDFTPPRIALNSLQPTYTPGPTSRSAQVTALGPGGRVDLGFSTTEALSSPPAMTLATRPMSCTTDALVQSCGYTHDCAALADGKHTLQVVLVDAVGNTFSGAAGTLEILSDCLAPGDPDVKTAGMAVWERAVFNTAGQGPTRLIVAANVVTEPRLTLLVGNDLGNNQLDTIASGAVGPLVGATTISPNLPGDRVRISVQSVDAAGNASAVVRVRENIASVEFSVTANAPAMKRGLAHDDLSTTSLTVPIGLTAVTGAVVNAISMKAPPGRTAAGFAHLGNGKVLLVGGTTTFGAVFDDSWVFDTVRARWVPTPGTRPQGRGSAGVAVLRPGVALMFGGSATNAVADGWLFDLAANAWSPIPGVQPSARSNHQLVSIGGGRALLVAGYGATGALNDTWVFDLDTKTWADITASAGIIPARTQHQLTDLGDGTLLLSGGLLADDTTPADARLFDLATMKWSKLVLAPSVASRIERKNMTVVAAGVGHAVLHGGSTLGGVFEKTAVYDSSTKNFRFSSGAQPTARVAMGLAYLGNGLVLIEGGQIDIINLSPDTSVFDIATLTWTPVTGAQPPTRQYVKIASTEKGQVIVPARTFAYDVWRFDVATRSWEQLNNTASGGPGYVAAALSDGRLFKYGSPYFGASSEMLLLSGATPTWSEVTGTLPDPLKLSRTNSAMSDLGNNRLLLFGGVSGFTTYTDTWLFDATTLTWSEVTGIATPPTTTGRTLTRLGTGQALLTDTSFNHWVFDDATRQWSAAPAGPSARIGYGVSRVGQNVALFGGTTTGPVPILEDTWVFDGVTHTWSQTASTLTQSAPVRLLPFTSGDALLSSPSFASVLDKTSKSWVPTTGYPRVTLTPAMPVGAHALVLGDSPPDDTNVVEPWALNPTTRVWTRLAQRIPSTTYSLLPMGQTRWLAVDTLASNGSIVFDELGEATTGVGAVTVASLGILAGDISSVAASVTAGADGYTLSGAAANGVDLQLYATTSTGDLFQTCGSGSGDSVSPSAVSCSNSSFTARSIVALRVKPKGFSNMKEVGLVVTRATIEVRYR